MAVSDAVPVSIYQGEMGQHTGFGISCITERPKGETGTQVWMGMRTSRLGRPTQPPPLRLGGQEERK